MRGKPLYFIFIIALCIRIIFLLTYRNGLAVQNRIMATDENIYIGLANNILTGKGYSLDGINPTGERVPLYPVFLSIVFFLGGEYYIVARIIQTVIGAASCCMIYLLGKEIFSTGVGIIAASIAIFYYPFIQMPAYLVTETLSIFLLLFSFWWFAKFKEIYFPWGFIICGILFGLTGLARSTVFVFYLILPLIIVITSLNKKEGLKQATWIIVGIALTLFPWTLRNYSHFHKFIPMSTRAGFVLYQGNNPMATGDSGGWWPMGKEYIIPNEVSLMTELERNSYFGEEATRFIKNNPGKFFRLFFKKISNMWRPYYTGTSQLSKTVMIFSYIPVMILGISGMFLSYKSWRKTFIFIVFILYYVLVHAVLVATIRYRWLTMPFFFIFAGFTVNHILQKFKHKVTT